MKKLMAITAILTLALMLGYMIFANPHIPLLDANRNVLATSELDGYCAGQAYSRNQPQPKEAADCRENTPGKASEQNLEVVQYSACQGVGVPEAQLNDCAQWMKDNQYWITLDAQLTNAWNNRFPYPLANNLITQENDSSRTGDRDSNSREGGLDRP